jgi:pimeloyl-ACP methyl ester carboxylesterase
MPGGLHIRVDGGGPAVTLLHSGVTDLHSWDEVAADLATDHTVIRYDLRGFGASPPPNRGFAHLHDLTAVLDEVGVARTALAGNSLGGLLALTFAVGHPDRVSHLGLLAPPLGGWDWAPDFLAYVGAEGKAIEAGDVDTAVALNQDQWVRGPLRDWTPPLRDLAAARAKAFRIAVSQQAETESHEFDDDGPAVRTALAGLTMPTTVVIGDRDVPDFQSIAGVLAAEIPGARLVTLAGAGHLLPDERPADVTAALRALLQA